MDCGAPGAVASITQHLANDEVTFKNQLSRFQGGGGLVSADTTTTTSNKSTFNLSAVKAQLHGISNNEKNWSSEYREAPPATITHENNEQQQQQQQQHLHTLFTQASLQSQAASSSWVSEFASTMPVQNVNNSNAVSNNQQNQSYSNQNYPSQLHNYSQHQFQYQGFYQQQRHQLISSSSSFRQFVPQFSTAAGQPIQDISLLQAKFAEFEQQINEAAKEKEQLASSVDSVVENMDRKADANVMKSDFYSYMKELRQSENINNNNSPSDNLLNSTSWASEFASSIELPSNEVAAELLKGRPPSQPAEWDAWKTQYLQNIEHLIEKDEGEEGTGSSWLNMTKNWETYPANGSGYAGWGSAVLAARPYEYVEAIANPFMSGADEEEKSAAELAAQGSSCLANPAMAIMALEASLQKQAEREEFDSSKLAETWHLLGLAQSQLERDDLAIPALSKATSLNPRCLGAWMALAVSYTNESCLTEAYDALHSWLVNNPAYSDIIASSSASWSVVSEAQRRSAKRPVEDRHWQLVNAFILVAKHANQNGLPLDENIQCALAILFNIAQDYGKAIDCLQSALKKTPDDYVMLNRLGATLANNGRYEEAIAAYSEALKLAPAFVRARYNLGISCMNLQAHSAAIQHLTTAIKLQKQAAQGGASGTSSGHSAMWDTLRIVCDAMERSDLSDAAIACDMRIFDEEFGQQQ